MAQSKPFTVWGLQDLGLDPGTTGLAGSPTQPGELHIPQMGRKAEMLEGEPAEVVKRIIGIMRAAGVLG